MKEVNVSFKTDLPILELLSDLQDVVGPLISISVYEHVDPVAVPVAPQPAAEPEAEPAKKVTKKKKKVAKKKKTTAKKSAAVEGADAANGVDPEPPAKFKEHTADDVRGILRDVLKHEELGNNAAKELLAKYGAANVSQLEETNFAAVIEDGQRLIDTVTPPEDPTA